MSRSKTTILVSSFPKSGATWFQFLIYSCYNGPFSNSKEVIRFYPPSNRSQLIEKSNQDLLFIKTHAAFSKGIPYLTNNSKCILITRHPLDVALSLINHHKNQGSLRLLFPTFRRKFLDQFLDENAANKNTSWSFHNNSWLVQNQHPLHIVKYDKLMSDPVAVLTKLRNDFDLKFNDAAIAKAVEYCSLTNMKSLENHEVENKIAGLFYSKRRKLTKRLLKSSFVNKGGSSDHQSTFSVTFLNRAAEILNPMIRELGLQEISKTENI